LKYKPDDSETKRKLDTVRTKVNMLFKFEEKSCFGIIRKKKQYENWNMDQIYRRICNRMFEIELWLEIRVFFCNRSSNDKRLSKSSRRRKSSLNG
jgi:hypothetical protein